MGIDELRAGIDGIDDELVRLFCGRMRVSGDIALYKARNGLPVFDGERERVKLADVLAKTEPCMRGYMGELYSLIFELSRSYQEEIINPAAGRNPCAGSNPGAGNKN